MSPGLDPCYATRSYSFGAHDSFSERFSSENWSVRIARQDNRILLFKSSMTIPTLQRFRFQSPSPGRWVVSSAAQTVLFDFNNFFSASFPGPLLPDFNSSAPSELSARILGLSVESRVHPSTQGFQSSRSLAMPPRKSKGKAKAVEDPPDLFRNLRNPDVIDFLESMRTPRSFSATLRSKDPNGVSDLLLKFQRTLPYIRKHLRERAKFPHDLNEVNYLYPVRKFYLEVLDDQGRADAKGCCPDTRFPEEEYFFLDSNWRMPLRPGSSRPPSAAGSVAASRPSSRNDAGPSSASEPRALRSGTVRAPPSAPPSAPKPPRPPHEPRITGPMRYDVGYPFGQWAGPGIIPGITAPLQITAHHPG
ncbi:hypothetical protein C8R43DRAFT_960360 [Mycena crocata]|nr:hypothetical protein C8R43DRAFT_960360 [Mycena crocata]